MGLIDIDVMSKWVKATPDRGVIEWPHDADEDRLYLSVVTIAEMRGGIERLPAGRRRANLTHWLESELPARFEGRLLPIDAEVADEAGRVLARVRASGREPQAMDALLAATALVHRFTLVTRNVTDFQKLGLSLFNPWQVD